MYRCCLTSNQYYSFSSQRFVDIHAQKKLVPPAYSGYVLAALAVKADKGLSGQFVNYSDESMSAYQPSH